MSYSISSFSPDFFMITEDFERDIITQRPISVYQAILAMREYEFQRWKNMARDVFGLKKSRAHFLTPETVLEKIEQTDACTTITPPVEVWIDPQGIYTVRVWEAPAND